VSAIVSAPLTNYQLALIGLHASQLPSYFVAEYVRSIVRVLAGDVIPSNEDVAQACEQMLKAAPVFEPAKARNARKRAVNRSNLPPSAMEQQIVRARLPRTSKVF
jgi:hypothetical protein